MKPSIPSSALDFKQMRTARVLLFFAVLAPLGGLCGFWLLPFVTLLGMLHAQRRPLLTLKMPFPTRIPGLFASKRVQGVPATRPLLGDAVLDSTLELALPDSLMHLSQEPSLLLQAVHGAQAQVNEDGISLNRQLDKAAFRANPQAAMAQVQEELAAIAALHAQLCAS